MVNPLKNRRLQEEYEADKLSVIKRRRDRYIQHFVAKEEADQKMNEVG